VNESREQHEQMSEQRQMMMIDAEEKRGRRTQNKEQRTTGIARMTG
jgi:hypothetical protein